MKKLFKRLFNIINLKNKKTNFLYTKEILLSENYTIGDYTYGAPNVFFADSGSKLKIGKFCSIAGEVSIFLGGNHRVDWFSTYPFNVLNNSFPNAKDLVGHPSTKGDVIIQNDVWIGAGVKILSGVNIGNGAVIAAYSVISKDIGDYEIWGGNPAKMIKLRFENETIEHLIKIKWWDWPLNKINKNVHILCSGDLKNLKALD